MYSIIIPSIGRINYLNELLSSIYSQSLFPKEIIILLDKNHNCRENAKFIIKKDICKIIFCDNLNLSQKRNYGALIANSKYLIFSDDDDIWEKDKAKLTVESLQKSQVVCHEYSKFGYINQNPKFLLGKKKKFITLFDLKLGSNIFGGGSGIASRKEIILSIPFDKQYLFCEDYDWWIRILLAETKVEYIPSSLVRYRVHKDNMTTNFIKIFRYNIRLFNKLIFKSIILLLSSTIGYVRCTLNLIFKLFKESLKHFIGN